MTTSLNTLSPNNGAHKSRTRVGRGIGSGKGKTCGRGVKGQKSRSGVAIKGFEGGQMPIHRRLPKRGFNNYNRKVFEVINLNQLQRAIDAGKLDAKKVIDINTLVSSGLAKGNKDGIKILSTGKIKQKIDIIADKASEATIKDLEKAGGSFKFAVENKPAEKASPKKETKK